MAKCLTIKFLKLFLLLVVLLGIAEKMPAQASPYAGFLDAMPLRKGEFYWHTSGFFNHVRVGVNQRLSLGAALLPSTLIDQNGLDWNLSANWAQEVAPKWRVGWSAFYWRSHYDDNYYLSNGNYNGQYYNLHAHLTYGTRERNLGLHTGLWRSGFWGHYIFTDDAFGGELFEFPDFSNVYTAPFVAVSMRHSVGPLSASLDASFYRNGYATGTLTEAVLRYTWPGVRLEYGMFHASQRYRKSVVASGFFVTNGLQYALLPVVNVQVALNRRTYRYWRADVKAARY
jgi:hypothetical protein